MELTGVLMGCALMDCFERAMFCGTYDIENQQVNGRNLHLNGGQGKEFHVIVKNCLLNSNTVSFFHF